MRADHGRSGYSMPGTSTSSAGRARTDARAVPRRGPLQSDGRSRGVWEGAADAAELVEENVIRTVENHVVVPAEAAAVWSRIVDPDGINHEMRPWMTMTMPSRA